MEPNAGTSVEQPNPTPTNPQSTRYDLSLNPNRIATTITETEFHIRFTKAYRTLTYTFWKPWERGMELIGYSTYSFPRLLTVLLRQLLGTKDSLRLVLAPSDTGILFSTQRSNKF